MSLPIIQSLWIGTELTLNEQLCISSFIYHKHPFHLYTYNTIKNIPNGVVLKDANEIIPESEIFQYYSGSYAGFADWFRWALLYKRGGFWVDTDVVCVKPFDFDSKLIFGLEGFNIVCPAVLGFPKNHKFCAFLEEACRKPNKFLPYDSFKIKKRKLKRAILGRGKESISWGESGGPVGFTKALVHFELLGFAKSFVHFFPISSENWNSIYDLTFEDDHKLFKNTYAVHLWNEKSRIEKFDKNAKRAPESLIEHFRSKYLNHG